MSFFINLDMPMGLESLDRVPTLEVTPPIAAVGREYDHAMAMSRHLLSHIGDVLPTAAGSGTNVWLMIRMVLRLLTSLMVH